MVLTKTAIESEFGHANTACVEILHKALYGFNGVLRIHYERNPRVLLNLKSAFL